MMKKLIHVAVLALALSFSLNGVFIARAQEEPDYAPDQPMPDDPNHYEDDRVLRVAIALGRASEALTQDEALRLYKYIGNGGSIPDVLAIKWNRLMRMAQAITLMTDSRDFFNTRYMVIQESLGVDRVTKLVTAQFGENSVSADVVRGQRVHKIRDDNGGLWVALDATTDSTGADAGILTSPEIKSSVETEEISALIWRLAEAGSEKGALVRKLVQQISATPDGAEYNAKVEKRTIENAKKFFGQYEFILPDILRSKVTLRTVETGRAGRVRTKLNIELEGISAGEAERIALLSLITQKALLKARSEALEGREWMLSEKFSTPLQKRKSLVKDLGFTDANVEHFLLGQPFELVDPEMRAYDIRTQAFEIETLSEEIVMVILPRDPKLRAKWRKMDKAQRVRAMARMGVPIDQEFSYEKGLRLTSEFYADVHTYPFLNPEMLLEGSGNNEIRSFLRGFTGDDEMKRSLYKIAGVIPKDDFRLHMHTFFPQTAIGKLTPAQASEFTDFIERLSFYMLLSGYNEAPVDLPNHFYDSYGLDRFSIKDLEDVYLHLIGKKKLGNKSQKYHNMAFRPVEGGLDIELRDIANDIDYGLALIHRIEEAVRTKDFGGIKFTDDKPLFFGFGENSERLENKFTMESAMAAKYRLTARQRELLRQFQFEVYKPFMSRQMYFNEGELTEFEETDPKDLNTKWVRTNFENNTIIPLLNYDDQSFLTAKEKKALAANRELYLERLYAVLQRVESDPDYEFMGREKNYLHLCDWLRISKHKTRPDFTKIRSTKEADRQRKLLEGLTFQVRGLAAQFTQETKILDAVGRSIGVNYVSSSDPITEPMGLKKKKDEAPAKEKTGGAKSCGGKGGVYGT